MARCGKSSERGRREECGVTKIVADSNIIVSLAFEDDSNHARALRLWKDTDLAYLPVVAGLEIGYFLLKNGLPLKMLEEILKDERIEVIDSPYADLAYAVSRKERVKSYDDLNDMLILGACRRLSLKLMTFDGELERLSEPKRDEGRR